MGIQTHLIRREESRGQKVAYISQGDYQILLETLINSSDAEIDAASDTTIPGYFYIIQLEPAFDAGRFKLGFASDLDERLRTHRTAAPFAALVGKWPCKLLWEKTAIDCISSGCEKLHTEVFRTSNFEDVVRRANAFFELMSRS